MLDVSGDSITQLSMRQRKAKTPPGQWIETAKIFLIANGIESVRVDRLAKHLKVTRGGFYHHFASREDLLGQLLQQWRRDCQFIPLLPEPQTPDEAFEFIHKLGEHLIREEHYDPLFDAAVRTWGRGDPMVARIVAEADEARLRKLKKVFLALGYDDDESEFRARIFYMHQLGYYQLGVRETTEERLANLNSYVLALAGRQYRELRNRRAGRTDDC